MNSARLGPWQMGRYRFRICSMLSEPYGSHYIRWRYQTTSRRRRTIIFSHSFFSTASSNFDMLSESPDERAFVVLFVPRPTTFRRDHLPSASVRGPRQRPTFGRLARLVRPLAARRSCCSAAAVYGVAGVTSREGMAANTVRYATCHKHAGRDVACCSHHPPCAICNSARARDMPDATRQDARLRGCGGPACALPGSDEGGSSAARAADAPCGAQHTMRRSSLALSCNVQHATCDKQRIAPCHSRRARHGQAVRVRLCTHGHSRSSAGLQAVWARAQSCMRA